MIRVALAGLQHPHVEYVVEEVTRRPDARFVALAEPEDGPRQHYADRLAVPAYRHHEELLDSHEVDVVAVAGIFADRAAAVLAGQRAGAHVLADKPLSTRLADLHAIGKEARDRPTHVSAMFEKRFSGATRGLREVVLNDEIGLLTLVSASGPHRLRRDTRPDWFFDHTRYGGILNDLAVHDLDLLLWLSGARAGTVTGWTGNRRVTDRTGFCDHGLAVVQVDGGPLASFEVHWLSPEAAPHHGDYRLRITGTEGTAEVSWLDERLTVATHGRAPWRPELAPSQSPAQDFFDAIAAGRRPLVDTAATLAASYLALTAQLSADTGSRPMRWSIDHNGGHR